jgi:hypothetical protein
MIVEKLAICSNSTILHCYNIVLAAISQHFVLNSVYQNNIDFFKLYYAIATVWQ